MDGNRRAWAVGGLAAFALVCALTVTFAHGETASSTNETNETVEPSVIRRLESVIGRDNPYETIMNRDLAGVLWNAAEKAGTVAKSVTHMVGEYVRDRKLEERQRELVERFYAELNRAARELNLSPADYRRLVGRVEQVYIEDGRTEKYKLDAVSFRDLPRVIRKEYGDMLLETTRDGEVTTYYMNGQRKALWPLRGGQPHGVVTVYYEDGEIRYLDTYDHGFKVRRQKFDGEGKLEFEQNYRADPAAAVSPEAKQEKAVIPDLPAADEPNGLVRSAAATPASSQDAG